MVTRRMKALLICFRELNIRGGGVLNRKRLRKMYFVKCQNISTVYDLKNYRLSRGNVGILKNSKSSMPNVKRFLRAFQS